MRLQISTPAIYRSLNKTIKDFYLDRNPVSIKYVDNFRTAIGSTILQVERVFAGLFGEKLGNDLMVQDYETFKRVFPNVYNSLNGKYAIWKNQYVTSGIRHLTGLIESIRNVNMHVKGYYHYKDHYTIPEDFRCFFETNENKDIKYLADDGQLTIGGMLFTIFSFANDSMFKSAQKTGNPLIKTFLASLIPGDEEIRWVSEEELVKTFNTHYEELIRPYVPNLTLEEAVAGKYYPDSFKIDGSFEVILEKTETYYRGISGHIHKDLCDRDVITINANSNLGEFFEEDYRLVIVDRAEFIEASSKVPPFQLVAYLYKRGINTFTKDCLLENPNKTAEEDISPYLKLNMAKFYVNKNVRILALKNIDADVKAIHTAFAPKFNKTFLSIERKLYERYNIPNQDRYSTLKEALEFLKMDRNVINKTVIVRNFFAHQNILGDKAWYFDQRITVDLEYVLRAFREFFDALHSVCDGSTCAEIEQEFGSDICVPLIIFKYNDIIIFWNKVLQGNLVENYEQQAEIYRLRMNCSIITPKIEVMLNEFYRTPCVFVSKDGSYVNIHKTLIVNNTNEPIVIGNVTFNTKELVVVQYKGTIDWTQTPRTEKVCDIENNYVKTSSYIINA